MLGSDPLRSWPRTVHTHTHTHTQLPWKRAELAAPEPKDKRNHKKLNPRTLRWAKPKMEELANKKVDVAMGLLRIT